MRSLAPAALLALLTIPSCSLLGLDRLDQATCMPGESGDTFCESLASVSPVPDACHRWQCNVDSRHCELEPLDQDADDAPAMTCEPAGVTADCDDDDRGNRPGGTETCDGGDNDCDTRTDEGTVGDGELVALRVIPTGSGDPAFGHAPDADESILAVLTPTGTGSEVNVVVDAGSAGFLTMPVRTTSGAAVSPTALTAAVGLGTNRYALLFDTGPAACRRVVLGILDTTTMQIRVESAHEPMGFPNTAADCSMGATSTGGMAIDASSGDLLVAYLEGARRDCGTGTASPVLVVGAPDATPGSATPIELGESIDTRPPAVVSLGGRVFLVAFPTAAGTVEVHRVTLAADGTATAALAYTEASDAGGRRGDVRLAVGPTASGTTTVGLVYGYGCGTAPVAARFLAVGTSVTMGARVAGTAPSGARHPALVYQPDADEWLLVWRTRAALGGLRIDAASMPIGGGFALTSATDGFDATLTVIAPGRTSPYRVLSARTEGGTVSAIAVELGCAPMTSSP